MTRVLIDEFLPRLLLPWLTDSKPEWTIQTVQGAGWASMKNGVMLRAANGRFDVLVTADKNMNLPLFDAPLSQQIMRPSYAVPPASFSQTASG